MRYYSAQAFFTTGRLVRLLILVCLFLNPTAPLGVRASQTAAPQPTAPQTLTGAAAHDFLAQAGLLTQLSAATADAPVNDRFFQTRQISASDGAAGDQFGYAVALDGDTALIGTANDNVGVNSKQGSAYVFVRAGEVWSQQAQLIASDGAANDYFGYAVALDGDTALVGAYNAAQGAAYAFVRTGTVWTQQMRFTASNGLAGDLFGSAVALSGDTALIGAPNADQGAAYIFVRTNSIWTQQIQLKANDGATGDSFGVAVSLDGDEALIGAFLHDIGANADQGAAYLFARTGGSWTQQAKLTASDGALGSYFGYAVALTGATALVGAYGHQVSANPFQGAAYIFIWTGAMWTEQARLIASDGLAGDQFGSAVALNGDTALVSAPSQQVGANSEQGAAYVFVRAGVTWTEQTRLVAGDNTKRDYFGYAVALNGDTALVSAPNHQVGASPLQGAAYFLRRSGLSWSTQSLAVGAAGDNFGFSVALSGDTALVGAPQPPPDVRNQQAGAGALQGVAYVFVRTGTTWTQQAQLTANDGATDDHFGYAVALNGDTALVGAPNHQVGVNIGPGAVYVFVRTGTTWTQQAQLTATDRTATEGFGTTLALEGDTALIGAPYDQVGANAWQGAAYVFVRTGAMWTQQAQLTASDGAADDLFGESVAISGDTALIGAYSHQVGVNADQGAAYVFVRTGANWSQQAQLTASDGAANNAFGYAVAISGDSALIGAWLNASQGAAYVFVRAGEAWAQQTKLSASDGGKDDWFGYAVALDGDTALVGAPYHQVVASYQDSAYVFVRIGSTWVQQTQLRATDGAASDNFGRAVALNGDTILIGAPYDDVIGNLDQGSAWLFVRQRHPQTIAFGALLEHILGDADFAISASADSRLPVTFTSLTPGVCTLSVNTVHLVGSGVCTLRSEQAGDGYFQAAPAVEQSFNVIKAAPPPASQLFLPLMRR